LIEFGLPPGRLPGEAAGVQMHANQLSVPAEISTATILNGSAARHGPSGAVWYYTQSNPAMSRMGQRTLERILAGEPSR
jgi:hypothetical protein